MASELSHEVELPSREDRSSQNDLQKSISTSDKSKDDAATSREPLSNFKNSSIVLVFEIMNSAAYYVSLAIGLLKYLSWGLSIIQVMEGVLIYSTIETLAQVLAAVLSDKTKSSLGRRKPFMLVGNIIQIISVFFLCLPPTNLTNKQLFAWYITFQSLSWGGFMFYFFPFKSWLIENSVDDEDYRRIRSVAVPIGALLGGISGTILMVFVPVICAFYNLIGGVIALALMILFTPSKPFRETDRVPEVIPSIRLCAQSKEFRQVFINQVFIEGGIATYNAIIVLLLITSFGVKKEGTASMLYLLMAIIGGIIGVAFNVSCNWIFTKVDKLVVYKAILCICVLICVITFFIAFDADNFQGMLILGVIFGIISAPANLIFNMFIRDLVIYDTFVTEYKRANMYISAILIPSNIISKFLSQIPIVVITLIGFKSYDVEDDLVANTYSWTDGCVWAIRAFASFFIAIFAIICYFSMKDYPLTGTVVNKMNEMITHRDAEALALASQGESTLLENKESESAQSTTSLNTNSSSTRFHQIQTSREGDSNIPASNNTNSSFSSTYDEVSVTQTTTRYPYPCHDDEAPAVTISVPSPTILSSDMTFSYEDKQLLLYLSKSELYRIFSSFTTEMKSSGSDDKQSSNSPSSVGTNTQITIKSSSLQGLHAIRTVVISSFVMSVTIEILLIAALVLDSNRLDGTFSTLLIYLVLLIAFLVVYEIFRLVALKSLSTWTADGLHHKARLLYDELISEKQSVESVMKQVEGKYETVIDQEVKIPQRPGDGEAAIGATTSKTMSNLVDSSTGADPVNAVDNDIEDYPRQVAATLSKVKKSEEDVDQEEAYFTFGYEYIALFQLACLGLAIFVLAYASNH